MDHHLPRDPPSNKDIISLTNLHLPHGVRAPDIWHSGAAKDQPALLSTRITLRNGFRSAAARDRLDANTLHYGQLAKHIRASSAPGQGLPEVLDLVDEAIVQLTGTTSEAQRAEYVAQVAVAVTLPQASMFGRNVRVTRAREWAAAQRGGGLREEFAVEDVQVMTLIGVNAVERTAKQPLLVSFAVMTGGWREGWPLDALFGLESVIVKYIESTSFETLESLIEATYETLLAQQGATAVALADARDGGHFRLAIKKPKAVMFAEAPAVEIWRRLGAEA